jgi:hypothetical protein
MGRKKKLVNKKLKKLIDKKCYFCPCNNPKLLDIHRIREGKDNGEYVELNTISVCSLCHRKIHCGVIKVDRKYYSTKGWILHYFDENGEEHYD